MTGIISDDLNSQTQRPGPNGTLPFLERGTSVNIVSAEYKDDTLWYILDNGIRVILQKVEIDIYSGLSGHDKEHFFMCYRAHNAGIPIIEMADAPDKLFFALLPPDPNRDFKVNEFFPDVFATAVTQAAGKLPESRKHVFVYMHGFDWEPGLKLDLLPQFAQSYFVNPDNSIAKVLYFGWPSYGWRKKADDRAMEYGQNFTKNGLFKYFEALSEKLKAEGKTLNLIVHSFGHQLLNGMINPGEGNEHMIPTGIFEHIFLMASDITHLSVQKNGVKLRNFRKKGRDFHYNLKPLQKLGNKVHIYYDPNDFLLYVSTKQFNGNSDHGNFDPHPDANGVTADYRNLGNYGDTLFSESNGDLQIEEGFNFHNIQDIIKQSETPVGDPLFYPFLDNTSSSMENARRGNYGGISLGHAFWERHFLMTHHQYLFSSKPVVDHVLKQLNTGQEEIMPEADAPIA